jgi:uncharacterized protein (DUF2235 family)
MVTNIVVLSDGTGNAASSVWRTNVWRMFESINLVGDDQVAKYDDGVGSSAFLPLALIGGAFGWGLKRNVIDAYKFICRNYAPGTKIFAFGFSRGAFTIRVLVAFILEQGLVVARSESELDRLAREAYRAYRANGYHSILRVEWLARGIRNGLVRIVDVLRRRTPYDRAKNIEVPTITFLGLWDTVAAYGLPIDEMTRGFSKWIWPLELPNRELSRRVLRACHALALDDERTTFHPVLWTEAGEREARPDGAGRLWINSERISQVWFVGMHANVGGGYPDDALAYVPMYWIMEQAHLNGLIFKQAPKADPDAILRARSSRDKDGRLYDSRSGLGGYYRYGPRKVADLCNARVSNREGDAVCIGLPKIHASVFQRIRGRGTAYAPIGLPADYAVVSEDGEILKGSADLAETVKAASARAEQQEKIWNLVWIRRLVYFLTVAASVHLGAFWLFHDRDPEKEFTSNIRLVSEAVRLVESFLPRAFHWWTDWYAANPALFLLGILAVVATIMAGAHLDARIRDTMRLLWAPAASPEVIPDSPVHRAIFALRTNRAYKWTIGCLKQHVFPFLSAAFMVWLAATGLSHLLFNVADSTGAFCREAPASALKRLNQHGDVTSADHLFTTDAMCFATGVYAEEGIRYSLSIEVTSPWKDDGIDTDPNGFRTARVASWGTKLIMYSGVPLRRILFRPWFRLIARVGAAGTDEYFLDPKAVPHQPNVYEAEFRAQRDGEIFLYVHDAAVALPYLSSIFYWNNSGAAKISVERN